MSGASIVVTCLMGLSAALALHAQTADAAEQLDTPHGCEFPPTPPIPPAGCKRMDVQCVCDEHGHCHFAFVCVRGVS